MDEASKSVDTGPVQASRATAPGLRWWVMGTVLAVASTMALSAWAGPGPQGHAGPAGAGPGLMFGVDPARLERGIDRMLDGLNASDAQRSQIRQIAQAAAADLKTQRDAGRALREQAAQVFTAPTLDAAAAESLRQQMLARHDQASRRHLQAMLDIAQVLTPEQRALAGQRMKAMAAQRQERQQRMERERRTVPGSGE